VVLDAGTPITRTPPWWSGSDVAAGFCRCHNGSSVADGEPISYRRILRVRNSAARSHPKSLTPIHFVLDLRHDALARGFLRATRPAQ
jgi:hypothetical protein